jgi:tetratricopeptide (TPR) repeat protein
MADKNFVQDDLSGEEVIAKAKDFWSKYGKLVTTVSVVLIVAIGGYYIYQNFFVKPKQEKAADLMYKAEEYYRLDSVNLALNGDASNPGFLKIMDKYSGTDAANLASYYAGDCYLKLNDNEKAVKYLKKFSTDAKPIQARAYKLIGDAYGDLGKFKEALDYYKKAAHHFEKDETGSAEALFLAAYLAQHSLNDTKEAIDLYKELKEKFPKTQQGFEAVNYLAQLGVYSSAN